MSIPTQERIIWNSRGWGVSNSNIFIGKYEPTLEFLVGFWWGSGGGVKNQAKNIWQKIMDISKKTNQNNMKNSVLVYWFGNNSLHKQPLKKLVNPLTPVPAVMSLGLSSTSDAIPFDQNWHHLYSTCTGGKHLFNDAHIRVTGQMEPKICTKMLKTLSEKFRTKFPATTPGCSIEKIARLDDAFLKVF